MVAKTQFAITGEDTRYFLNGALFILRPDTMSLVSTDGHRLALITVPRQQGKEKSKGGAEDEVRVILPRKTLLELGRLLAEGEGDIHYERGENHLFFDIGGRLLISRMIDGQFPAFERVIPKSNDKRVEFDRDRLTSAVRRVALLSNERSRAVKFQIEPGKVEIASSSPEFGEAKELLMVDYAGQAVTICFNAQYVLDFLAVAETDSVGLEFKDEMSQAVMKPINAEGYDYTYVIMPMRV
jgi:DNA polymerase-3 subunit beta